MQIAYILNLLSQLLSLVPAGTALYDKFTAQRTQAEQWAATNYVPTDADWSALNDQIAADSAAIDAGAAR